MAGESRNKKIANYCVKKRLKKIVKRSADILSVRTAPEAAVEIAKRARLTPRVANRLLKRIRDFAQMKNNGDITKDIADEALDHLEIDELGLDNVDREILKTIILKFKGGPVGLGTLAAATREEVATIEEIYEPFLLQLGLLNRTPRGRMATESAYKHLALKP